jgi:hypothetical protein
MNPLKKLTDLVALKNVNLNLIADLLNTPNVDIRDLQNAKDTQDYLNYQISLIKTQTNGKLPIPVINSPIFQEHNETSLFASFKPTDYTLSNINNVKEWEFNARQLLPKEMSFNISEPILGERNKEEMIFRPSQQQLSGQVHLPEDNWVQNLPTIVQVPQKIEPIQEELIYNPIKCGSIEKNTINSANFIKIPETTTEIEQAVKRDLQSLQQQNVEHVEEDFYTDPYNEY